MSPSDRFQGKAALVTGSARRLGRELVLELADAGARVAVHYRRSAHAAESLCGLVRDRGGEAIALRADLEEEESGESLLEAAWSAMHGLDFLVNNASIFPPGRLDGMTLQELHHNLQVNTWAPFSLTRAFWRRIRGTDRRGSVVNLLDTRLVGGDLAHAPYHLSKALLAELTTLTALEFAPELQVNAVAPGAVLPPEGMDEEYLQGLVKDLPLQRRGYPEDIATAAIYLLGASFVTGQVIFVDGGRHIRMGGST